MAIRSLVFAVACGLALADLALGLQTPDCGNGTQCGELCAMVGYYCKDYACYANNNNAPAPCVSGKVSCGGKQCLPESAAGGLICGTNVLYDMCLPRNCDALKTDSCCAYDGQVAQTFACPAGYSECKRTDYFTCKVGPTGYEASCTYAGPCANGRAPGSAAGPSSSLVDSGRPVVIALATATAVAYLLA